MATTLIARLAERLSSEQSVRDDGDLFGLIQQISRLVNAAPDDLGGSAHDLVLRACEWRDAFGSLRPVLDAVIRQRGLFPYLEPEALELTDRIAYELHRPLTLDDTTVFHRVQNRVYQRLLAGRNVVLSAPTSFGKSLIIDAIIATDRYRSIAVVVPTIALIDETRRRLFARFGTKYRLVTHRGQERGTRTIFVLTPERVVEFDAMAVDFFVIDEFYKLDPVQEDPARSATLNEALYRLGKGKPQFYMLGPNIRSVPEQFLDRYECEFIYTDYGTVVSEQVRIPTTRSTRLPELLRLFTEDISGPTLVYCSSPDSARRVSLALAEGLPERPEPELRAAAAWAAAEFHPEWGFVSALARGIGVHHGKLPRSLAQFVVRAFNAGLLDTLICTSTLIEGVNTRAKNVVVYDNVLAGRKLTYFAFSNIRGRSGRMLRHFVGKVYLLHAPPKEDMPDVDISLVTQTEHAPDSLLIQLADEDLSDVSRERVRRLYEQRDVPPQVLQANRGIDPWSQVELARLLRAAPQRYWARISWSGFPTSAQLRTTCELIWRLVPPAAHEHGAVSASQLATKIDKLRVKQGVRPLIDDELSNQRGPKDPDAAVEDTLDFLRFWASYHFPRYLMALGRIQSYVFETSGLPAGDYAVFASEVEHQFAPPALVALEEYGIPIQVARRLGAPLSDATTLDEALSAVRTLDVSDRELTSFERDLVSNARAFM